METIAKNINNLIETTNTDPLELSKIAGVSRTAIYQWRRGAYTPSIKAIKAITAHFPGMNVSHIIEECDEFWENYGKQ